MLSERIGLEQLADLQVSSRADDLKIHTLSFKLGANELVVEGAQEVLAALFGSPELDPLAEVAGELGDVLGKALPLPLPMYGLNFL